MTRMSGKELLYCGYCLIWDAQPGDMKYYLGSCGFGAFPFWGS